MPDEFIATIIETFDGIAQDVQQEADQWGGGEWTVAVLTALCQAGREHALWVTATSSVPEEHRDGYGEWLYDACWCAHDEEDWFLRLEMAAESEWANMDHIIEDFQKLLVARAILRVMVFDARWLEGEMRAMAETLQSHVNHFRERSTGDTYLLVGYNQNNDVWWWEYATIQVGEPGEQPTLRLRPL